MYLGLQITKRLATKYSGDNLRSRCQFCFGSGNYEYTADATEAVNVQRQRHQVSGGGADEGPRESKARYHVGSSLDTATYQPICHCRGNINRLYTNINQNNNNNNIEFCVFIPILFILRFTYICIYIG